jgi:hypothetical protein
MAEESKPEREGTGTGIPQSAIIPFDKGVGKGPILEKIDGLSRDPATRDRFLGALEQLNQQYHQSGNGYTAGIGYVDTLFAFQVLDQGGANHLRQHWFPSSPQDPGAWWPDLQPIAPIFLEGMLETFRQAQSYDLPMECYWLYPFEDVTILIARSDSQITHLRLTPNHPGPYPARYDDPRLTHEEPIVIVSRGAQGQVSIRTLKRLPRR